MNDKLKSLREGVLAKIKDEKIAMHSRAYFILKLVALGVVALLVLGISVFLFNFVIFAIHANGSDELLGFGNRGFLFFVQVFPWPWLIADVLLIVLLEWLLRGFRFGYKSPVLYLLLAVFIVTVSSGVAVDRATPFNDFLRDRAHEHRLPGPFNDLFERSQRPPGGPDGDMCRCTVTAVQGSVLLADDIDVGTTTHMMIRLPQDDTRATSSGIAVGDVIFVAGDRHGDTIDAFGIRKLPPGSPSIDPGASHAETGPSDTDDLPPDSAETQ